jgi:hypothetical protein
LDAAPLPVPSLYDKANIFFYIKRTTSKGAIYSSDFYFMIEIVFKVKCEKLKIVAVKHQFYSRAVGAGDPSLSDSSVGLG